MISPEVIVIPKDVWVNYIKEAIKTSQKLSVEESYFYSTHKLISELGEVLGEIVKLKFHKGLEGDTDRLESEIGDCFWYLANIMYQHDVRINLKSRINSVQPVQLLVGMIERTIELSLVSSRFGMQYEKKHLLQLVFERLVSVCEKYDLDVERVLAKNVEKVRARHGESYNEKGFYDRKEKES